jgi:hypothetical protein
MKVLYCTKCKSLIRLRTREERKCGCSHARVVGRYRRDRKHADISDNVNTISIAIDNRSFSAAIKRMRWWKKHRPKSDREDYKSVSSIVAWVRPNTGPGNPHSHRRAL